MIQIRNRQRVYRDRLVDFSKNVYHYRSIMKVEIITSENDSVLKIRSEFWKQAST